MWSPDYPTLVYKKDWNLTAWNLRYMNQICQSEKSDGSNVVMIFSLQPGKNIFVS